LLAADEARRMTALHADTVLPQPTEARRMARDLARSARRARWSALLLVAPLLLFLLVVFIGPLLMMLSRGVRDAEVAQALPATVAALRHWDPAQPVPDAVFGALANDLSKAHTPAAVAEAAARLNYALPGLRAMLMSARARMRNLPVDPKTYFVGLSPRWADKETWSAIRQASGPLTDFYILSALDLRRNAAGSIESLPAGESAFVPAILRTFGISLSVTAFAILLGFPFAYLMATTGKRVAGLMMLVLLLPFWTAVMVRVLAWSMLLGREGIVNDGLRSLGLLSQPLDLLYNRTAVMISLVHIFIPYMVLPLYSVMRTIPAAQMRAAASLGAPPAMAFRRIFLPQVVPGLAAGSLLVFIHSLGVFVVPAVLGGPREQGLPVLVVNYVTKSPNWGLAAALSMVLLLSVYLLYWLFVKLTKSVTPSVSAR
jgi:putative spermidine/putrescine transport system permease protein